METVFTSIGGVVTMLIDTAGDVITLVTAQPILLIGIGMAVLGGAVGFVAKLRKGR